VTHELLVLQPGKEPDEDLAAIITNPGCWEEPKRASADEEPEETAGPGNVENPPEPEPARTPRRRATKKPDAEE
jgi:hypothetical protein